MKLTDLNVLSIGHTIQMSGIIFSGEGKSFLCFLPEDKNDLPHEVLELDAEDWKTVIRQTDLLETEVISKASDGSLAKIILRKSQRQIDTVLQWTVWRRDNFQCCYCGNNTVPMTIDHLVCWEAGGATVEPNLLTACKRCNKTRGNISYEAWLKHPRYREVSKKLPEARRQANEALLATLPNIQLNVHARTR